MKDVNDRVILLLFTLSFIALLLALFNFWVPFGLAVSGCCIPPAIAQSRSGPPATSRRSPAVTSFIRHSSRNFPLKLSQYPFSHGLPGSMYNVPVPRFPSHWRNFWATNSGPLSDRMCSGIPRHSITSDNVSARITSRLPILRSTRIAKHSRVYSSSSVSNRSVLPSCVLALTKS